MADISKNNQKTYQPSENFKQIDIPVTTIENYITGVYALNIPDENGELGDWHHNVFWYPVGIGDPKPITLGGKDPYNTNPVYGNMGVQEAKSRVENSGLKVASNITEVWVANHMRAILDMVFAEITIQGEVKFARNSTTDWLGTVEQKNSLLRHAVKLEPCLNQEDQQALHKWINEEKSYSY